MSETKNQAIELIKGPFSVHQLKCLEDVPALQQDTFFSLTLTDSEISLVCNSQIAVDAKHSEAGWRLFKLIGPFEFNVIGVLKKIATILADNQISIFAISTFETDYILVKEAQYESAMVVLSHMGYDWV